MSPEEIDAFIAEKHTLSIATLNRDGSIHMVAMWYGFLEGRSRSRRRRRRRRCEPAPQPEHHVMAEEGDAYNELIGVSIQGTAEIVEDPERMFATGSVFERHTAPYDDMLARKVESCSTSASSSR